MAERLMLELLLLIELVTGGDAPLFSRWSRAFSVARIFLPAKLSAGVAIASAVLLIPVNAVLINPVFSSALAMLYFRARQANGEDIALSAILPTRL